MRQPAATVLDALLSGQIITFVPYGRIQLGMDDHVCMEVEVITGSILSMEWYKVDLDLGTFIRDCNKLTQNELVIISANTVLGKL